MDLWVIWVIVAAALAAGEMHNFSFYLAPFAVGALGATIVAAIGGGILGSGLVFIALSMLMVVFVRPIATRHLRQPPHLRTGTAALVGKQAMVLERIANDEGLGVAKIDGEAWTARAFDEDRTIEAGTKVHVIEIRGATALVD